MLNFYVVNMAVKKISEMADTLWKEPSRANWKKFDAVLKKSGIKYYSVKFEDGKLNKKSDLLRSYVELFDSKEKFVAKVPVFEREGKKIEGATINLIGLSILNKVE